MPSFVAPRDRDAYASIRGFVYQVALSLVCWLDLQPSQALELERGEDIDLISQYLSADGEQEQRLFEQIKRRQDKSLTMRSPEAIAAVVNFYEHRTANPELRLLFRYTTNAPVGREYRSPMPNKMPALQAWEQIRQGLMGAPLLDKALSGIKKLLNDAPKPDDIREETWAQFCIDLQKLSQNQLSDLIQDFEWSNKAADLSELHQTLCQRLVVEGYAADLDQAERRYEHLFFYVFQVLSQPGIKRLTIEDRQVQLALPVLGEQERQRLHALLVKVSLLEQDVTELKLGQAKQAETLARIDTQVQSLSSRQGVDTAVMYTSMTPNLTIPPLVEHLSQRVKAVEGLKNQVMSHTWTALWGNAAVGKTQLAVLLAQQLGIRCIWIDFSSERTIEQCCVRLDAACKFLFDQEPQGTWALWYSQLPQRLVPSALLVLDSLPQLSGRDGLSERLLTLTNACRGTGVRILSISVHQLPKYLHERFSHQNLSRTTVPPFSNQEVAEVLRTYDAPAPMDEYINAISLLGRRHPLLVKAIIEYLHSLDWQLTDQTYRALFSQTHATEVNEETLSRLISTIQDQSSRDLLYRLSLIAHAFSLEEVQALAQVDPQIGYPRERLQPLIGPWVERDQNNSYRISPLIQVLGDDLTPQTRRACNGVLAEYLLHKGPISPGEVGEVVAYLLAAEQFNKAAWVFLRTLIDINLQPRLVHDMGLLAFWADKETPLPSQIDLGFRLYIRAHQIVALQKRNWDTAYLENDLRSLVTQATEQEAWAILGIIVAVPQAVPNIHHALQLVLRAGPVFKFPEGETITIPPDLELEQLIWVAGSLVKSSHDLRDWMETVEQLRLEQRQTTFQGATAEQGCLVTVNNVWMREHEKPKVDQHWDEILATLQHVAERALQLGLELLWACAVQASIIVLADYQEKLSDAVALEESALAQASEDPRIRFLIEECTARQYLEKHQEEEALRWLQRALDRPTEAYPSLRMSAMLRASQCIGMHDAQAAILYAQQGVEVGMAFSEVPVLDIVRAWGELAIAQWLRDNRLAAFEAWDQAGQRLLACKTETDRWKSLFQAYGHVSGYFASVAATGQPPMALQAGQSYPAPTRGFLHASHPQLAAKYDPTRDAFLFVQLATFAEAVGQDERAVEWAEQGIDTALATRQVAAYLQLSAVLISPLIKQDRYEDALDRALEAGLISKALALHHEAGGNILSPDLDVRSVLGSKPNGHWDSAEYQAAQIGLLPCILRLSFLAITSPERLQDQAKRTIALCKEIGTTASNQQLWRSSAHLLDQSFLANAGTKALHQESVTFDSDLLRCLAYLGESLQSDIRLVDAFSAHAIVVGYTLHVFDQLSTTHRSIILPFIRDYWVEKFHKKRALFSSPAMVERELQAALAESEQKQVRAILTAIAYGVGGDVGLLDDI